MSSTLTINTNLASLNAQRRLGESTTALQASFERLSSGLRINKASDDAAGLAIATSLNVDARVYNQGIRNLNDGISLYSIAEGAVDQLSNVVTRIRELAEQSSNGTIAIKQRNALNSEANALVNEYNRIVSTTSFNGQNLLDGTLSTVSIQNGYGQNGALQLTLGQGLQRNVGDGTYSAPTSYAAGGSAFHVITADVNGDGQIDLLSNDFSTNKLYVELGNGDGTFQSAVAYTANGTHGQGITTGDINGDGKTDVVTADYGTNTVSVLIGNGNGSFHSSNSFTTGLTNLLNVNTSDVNGDGRADIVYSGDNGANGVVGVLLGNGDGTFRSLGTFAAPKIGGPIIGVEVNSETVADINGDGRLDVVTSGYSSKTVNVLLGNGDGSYRASTSYAASTASLGTVSVVATDVNGDGLLDLVAANYFTGAGNLSVFIGNGDGSFRAISSFGPTPFTSQVIAADINGDGRVDLVTADDGHGASILFGNGDGSFGARTSFALASPFNVSAADVNGDGRLDLVGADSGVFVILGNGGTSSFLPVLNLNNQSFARNVLDQMQISLNGITAELGIEGAAESRLQIATTNLQQIRQNYIGAASQILDVDVASEAAILAKNNILQQAGAAILAQANQQPALALKLLQGI